MTQLPRRRARVGGLLIDNGISAERALNCRRIERLLRREGVKAAAAHGHDLVDEHVALRAQLAAIARLAQDARGGIATAVAERGKGNLDQRQPVEMGKKQPRVLVRLQPHRGGVGLAEERIQRHRRLLVHGIVAEAQRVGVGGTRRGALVAISHRSPP
jgi:hypothetical protein